MPGTQDRHRGKAMTAETLPEVHKFDFFAGRRSIMRVSKRKGGGAQITMFTKDLSEEQLQTLFTARELVFHVEAQWRDWSEVEKPKPSKISDQAFSTAWGDLTG
jgi:hypothetical protein